MSPQQDIPKFIRRQEQNTITDYTHKHGHMLGDIHVPFSRDGPIHHSQRFGLI